MKVDSPTTLADALAVKAADPAAVPLAGGTDLMVDINFDRRRPETILDLTRVAELRPSERDDGHVRIGATATYTDILREFASELPGLALASRTVGSPQIRNRGTLAGNLGTASPAGDGLPPLFATGASVEVASARGARAIDVRDFVTGVKRNALEDDELIVAVRVPVARGPQQFAKIGTRNAMVIAVTNFAVALDVPGRRIGTAIGSAGPGILRATEAETFLAGALDDGGLWARPAAIPEAAVARFGELVADAARPIDDVRGSARYRRHALAVLARRTLTWAWDEHARSRT